MSYFQVITPANHRYWWPFTLIIIFAGAQAIIKLQSVRSLPVVSRWLWPWNRTFLEVASIVVIWCIVAFCAVKENSNFETYILQMHSPSWLSSPHLWDAITTVHISGCISYWCPDCPSYLVHLKKHWPGNLGSLGSNKEIHPQLHLD